ncbi:MAG: hypothetical protein K1X88_13825 [Nannocystaceae bacterium]|nr:hypothetical protein [Nannocystaceae bacterium]
MKSRAGRGPRQDQQRARPRAVRPGSEAARVDEVVGDGFAQGLLLVP